MIFLRPICDFLLLALGPATLGQYLDLQPFAPEGVWNSKKNDVLTETK